MGLLADILTLITEFFDLVFGFVISLFKDIVYVISLLGKFVLYVPSYFSWLPDQLLGVLTTILAIVVIYKLIGREG